MKLNKNDSDDKNHDLDDEFNHFERKNYPVRDNKITLITAEELIRRVDEFLITKGYKIHD